MKLKFIILTLGICFSVRTSYAQWIVSDPGNFAQGIVNAAKNIVHTSKTATNMAANFQETVKLYEQGKAYYDALKSVKNLIKGGRKVQQTILAVGEITDIFVNSFQKMLSDPYFRPEELEAIATGYTILLEESANTLDDLRTCVNENGLSMTDKDRLDIIEKCHKKVSEYKALTQYYTNKTIGVSYLRAKMRNDQSRILALYGQPSERYW